jgi:hypothetical protein
MVKKYEQYEQNEIDLIYDYLHEHFEYKEGELIFKKDTRNKNKGEIAGHFVSCFRDGHAYIKMHLPAYLSRTKKDGQISLAHAIYIFHHKKKPKYVSFIDGNHVNTKIENLCAEESAHFRSKLSNRTKELKLVYERHLKSGTVFCVRGELDDKNIIIGEYNDRDLALKAAVFLNELKYTGLSTNEIKNKVLERYPRPLIKTNKTGFLGVYKHGKKYSAYIFTNKTRVRIGDKYETAEEAHEAYLKAKRELLNK